MLRVSEVLKRIIWDDKYFKKEEVILGILERDGSIKYLEFSEYDLKEGWLWKNGFPKIPLHRVVEIRRKDGKIIWKNPKYLERKISQTEREEHR